MTDSRSRTIRAWGMQQGICGATGRLSLHTIEAFEMAFPEHAEQFDAVDDTPPVVEEPVEHHSGPPMLVLGLPEDVEADIAKRLGDALMAIFEAGVASERRRILEQIGIAP